MAAPLPPALHHPLERAVAKTVDPVAVMQLARAVNAQAEQEMELSEKTAPFLVDQGAVGLDAVRDDLPRPTVFFHQGERALQERQSHQRWFATLPGQLDPGVRRSGQEVDVATSGNVDIQVQLVM